MTKPILLPGLQLIEPRLFHDNRGYFFETHQTKRYAELGLPTFVQDNFSRSNKNVLRGLHYQLPFAQGKLVYVSRGSVWDVAVDIRRNSPTFGKWCGVILSDENHWQLYIPPGFAHGFCVLSETADFHYKCTEYYTPQAEHGIMWNCSTLNIDWPVKNPVLSSKDLKYTTLDKIHHDNLFE